jgi:hypothetical protein
MLDALALVAGLALAITASVFAETRWPVPEGSWRWAVPGPLLRKLIIVTRSSWDLDQYVFALLLIGRAVCARGVDGPYGGVAAFLLVTAARMGTHAALRSLNVTSDDDASA